jgi:hypothetical protein
MRPTGQLPPGAIRYSVDLRDLPTVDRRSDHKAHRHAAERAKWDKDSDPRRLPSTGLSRIFSSDSDR